MAEQNQQNQAVFKMVLCGDGGTVSVFMNELTPRVSNVAALFLTSRKGKLDPRVFPRLC